MSGIGDDMQQLSLFTEHYQPRFQAYLDHMGAVHQSEVNMRYFIAWISGHAEDFKRINNTDTLKGMQNEFTDYVREKVKG